MRNWQNHDHSPVIGAGSHRLLASTTPEKLPGGSRQKLAEQRTWSMLRRSAVVRAQAPRQFSRSAHLKMLLERTWRLSAPRDRTRSAQVNRAGFGASRILQSQRVSFPRSSRTLARGCAAGEKKGALFYTTKSGIFIRSFDEFVPKTCKLLRFVAARPDDAPPLTVNTSQRRQPRRLKPCAIDPQQSAR